MRSIREFLHRHLNETAWIVGKGPSLDGYDWDAAGPLRICINESVKVVPHPTYFFAHDEPPIRAVAGVWPAGCTAVLQQVRADLAVDLGLATECIAVYEKRYCDNDLRNAPAETIAKRAALYGNSGTVHCAIHFCRLVGITRIVLVGFDGANGYAECLALPPGGAEHERIRRDSVSLLRCLEIPYVFVSGRH